MGSIAMMAALAAMGSIKYVVTGIQIIHGESIAGADKKTMAMDALSIATAAANEILPPEEKILANAASQMVSMAIDNVVQLFKMAEAFGFHKSKILIKPVVK